jgi:hypothetical protein
MANEENQNLNKFSYSDDDSLAAWLGERDPAEEAFLHRADAYVMGDVVDPETGRGLYYGYTPAELQAWFEGLTQEQQTELSEQRQISEHIAKRFDRYVEELIEGLTDSAPSLLRGRLPAEQEASLPTADYVIGTNQSGVHTFEEAEAHTAENQGVDVTNWNLNNRFQFVDPDVPEHLILQSLAGYYGEAGGGRFVVAVPDNGAFVGESVTLKPDHLWRFDHLPADFFVEWEEGENSGISVSPKYLAGYIHMDGRYYPNRAFMQDPPDGPRFDVRPPADGDWL